VEIAVLILAWISITAAFGVGVQWMLRRDERLARTRDIQPHCGRCSYIARGLLTRRCPECGSDLRIVGVDWE
jgi:hypothetical protein